MGAQALTDFQYERVAIRGGFSRGELDVAELLLQAKSDQEMAETLGVNKNSVKMRMSRMFLKAGIDTNFGCARVKLAMWLHEHRSLFGILCQACGERT